MRACLVISACAVLALVAGASVGAAQECKPDDVFKVIDGTGQRLREMNGEAQPRMRTKLRELGKKNGWKEEEIDLKGRGVIEDEQTRAMDGRAGELLTELDRLGDIDRQGPAICERLEQARTKAAQLVEVTAQRNAHAMARIDIALRPTPLPAPAPAPQQQTTAAVEPPRPPPAPPLATPPSVAQPRPKALPAPVAGWDARTMRDVEPPPPPAPVIDATPPMPDPGSLGYSPEEIRAAGRGLFGTISAGLASVIDHAFQKLGRPTGYILGDEGGGAFFAGLRYGDGRVVTKTQGERKVYWQGPSAGFDFGLAGSQVLFLVYNVEDHEQLFQRFSGIDGSAYVVGGVGMTFLKRGRVILAPIRTGLGLRVGANIGYIKFTDTPSINPF